jgi:hypothetical protein
MTISISGLTIHPLFLNLDNVYVLHTNVNIVALNRQRPSMAEETMV